MKNKINTILNQIRQCAIEANRNPDSVKLVAVSKTKPQEAVVEAIESGLSIFGENYIQEAIEKIDSLTTYNATWHFIGHLQRNKAKFAVSRFDLIHSVDSLKLAKEINKQAAKIDKIQKILIQVNISGEETKSGTTEDHALTLIHKIAELSNVSIVGLMTMPPLFGDPVSARPYFKALKQLSDRVKKESIPNVTMDELSMGMTNDFEAAIQEGATLVRIGTAIFGARK